MNHDEETAVEQAIRLLVPLCEEFNLSLIRRIEEDWINRILFGRSGVGFEVNIEALDQLVEIDLVDLRDGAVPGPLDRQRRVDLFFLARASDSDASLVELHSLRTLEDHERAIVKAAGLLRQYAGAFLQGDFEMFDRARRLEAECVKRVLQSNR